MGDRPFLRCSGTKIFRGVSVSVSVSNSISAKQAWTKLTFQKPAMRAQFMNSELLNLPSEAVAMGERLELLQRKPGKPKGGKLPPLEELFRQFTGTERNPRRRWRGGRYVR
jgi:hypothetical protein